MPNMSDQTVLDGAAACLESGGVVFVPTDTVFGLAALPSKPDAVARVFALKDRPANRNLPVMVSNVDQLQTIGAIVSDSAQRLIASDYVPGPLSVVLALGEGERPEWLAGREEIAFRMPNDRFMLDLLDRVGPLFVTSANRHGMGTLGSVAEAVAQLAGTPDFVVEGKECGSVPSTLVNCRLSPPVIERPGAVSEEEISKVLGA